MHRYFRQQHQIAAAHALDQHLEGRAGSVGQRDLRAVHRRVAGQGADRAPAIVRVPDLDFGVLDDVIGVVARHPVEGDAADGLGAAEFHRGGRRGGGEVGRAAGPEAAAAAGFAVDQFGARVGGGVVALGGGNAAGGHRATAGNVADGGDDAADAVLGVVAGRGGRGIGAAGQAERVRLLKNEASGVLERSHRQKSHEPGI